MPFGRRFRGVAGCRGQCEGGERTETVKDSHMRERRMRRRGNRDSGTENLLTEQGSGRNSESAVLPRLRELHTVWQLTTPST
jgi:hypothetical protein